MSNMWDRMLELESVFENLVTKADAWTYPPSPEAGVDVSELGAARTMRYIAKIKLNWYSYYSRLVCLFAYLKAPVHALRSTANLHFLMCQSSIRGTVTSHLSRASRIARDTCHHVDVTVHVSRGQNIWWIYRFRRVQSQAKLHFLHRPVSNRRHKSTATSSHSLVIFPLKYAWRRLSTLRTPFDSSRYLLNHLLHYR